MQNPLPLSWRMNPAPHDPDLTKLTISYHQSPLPQHNSETEKGFLKLTTEMSERLISLCMGHQELTLTK